MARVSRNKLEKKLQDVILLHLVIFLAKIKNTGEAQYLVNDLFTPTERLMLAKRVAIAMMVLKGVAYREISVALKVSQTTISSVSDALNLGGAAYRDLVKRIEKDQEMDESLQDILKIIAALNPMPPIGRGRWRGWYGN